MKYYTSRWLWNELGMTDEASTAKAVCDALFKRAFRAVQQGRISGDVFQAACDDLSNALEVALERGYRYG